jgi:hypothetical protein
VEDGYVSVHHSDGVSCIDSGVYSSEPPISDCQLNHVAQSPTLRKIIGSGTTKVTIECRVTRVLIFGKTRNLIDVGKIHSSV